MIIPDMRGGGAERVALSLIEGFLNRGHEVDLVLMKARGELMELIPSAVHVTDLKADRVRQMILPLARYLRERRPDAVQASMWPVTVAAVLAKMTARNSARLVVSEHSNMSVSMRERAVTRWVARWSLASCYPRADARICVSKDVVTDIAALSGMRAEDFDIVHNPIPQPTSFGGAPPAWLDGKRVLAVGTLKRQKNYPLLLRAFARLRERVPATLTILGEGELRSELEGLAVELGVAEHLSMPGFVIDPTPYYASADVFALSSDWEGFANVLAEALLNGLPVVSTDCPSGPSEVLAGGRYGRLVPVGEEQALSDALEATLAEKRDGEALRARGRDFNPERAVSRYLELLLPDADTVADAAGGAG